MRIEQRPEMQGIGPGIAAMDQTIKKQNRELQALKDRPGKEDSLHAVNKDGEPSLGELNPLIHPIDLFSKGSVNTVKRGTIRNIKKYGGMLPVSMESTLVHDPINDKSGQRFVARFEIPAEDLTEEKITLLEDLVKQVYGPAVRTRTDSKGNDIEIENYPPISLGEEWKAKRAGWYMGKDLKVPTTSLYNGLYVFQDLGTITKENFAGGSGKRSSEKCIVEIREEDMYQTDLSTFITQVSSILGKGEMLDAGDLLYQTYNDLMRLNIPKVDKDSVYGLDDALDKIYRGLITPIASPDLSAEVGQKPESVLMIGIPGTGKTLLAKLLLHEENDAIFLPLDPIELKKELLLPKEDQTLLPRFAEVSKVTGRSIVMLLDDLENMTGADDDTHSTVLNLMAGVQENNFLVVAATNVPEKIDTALLQPQRFGILIHFPLQDEKARFEILKLHANERSNKLGLPLFESAEERLTIMERVASRTDYFTPRYLGEIATVAKSNLLRRVVEEKGTRTGLKEEDLEGHRFTVEDWGDALTEVSSRYDAQKMRNRDEWLRDFVNKHSRNPIGFSADEKAASGGFSQEVYNRLEELRKTPDNDLV